MEAKRFDRLAALVGDASTRRSLLRGTGAGALSALLERLWPSAPEAQAYPSGGGGNKDKKKNKKKHNPKTRDHKNRCPGSRLKCGTDCCAPNDERCCRATGVAVCCSTSSSCCPAGSLSNCCSNNGKCCEVGSASACCPAGFNCTNEGAWVACCPGGYYSCTAPFGDPAAPCCSPGSSCCNMDTAQSGCCPGSHPNCVQRNANGVSCCQNGSLPCLAPGNVGCCAAGSVCVGGDDFTQWCCPASHPVRCGNQCCASAGSEVGVELGADRVELVAEPVAPAAGMAGAPG